MRANVSPSTHEVPEVIESVKFRRIEIKKPAPVLCSTDFSPTADKALEVAADFARQLGAPLAVTHPIGIPRTLVRDKKASEWITAARQRTLRETSAALRVKGLEVRERVRPDSPAKAILQVARDENAQLIVVPVAERRFMGQRLRASGVAQIAGKARSPVLMLRDAEPLRRWLQDDRPLKVVVAYNFSTSSEAALSWVKQLTRIGPCEVVLAYTNQPYHDYMRIGAQGPLPFGHNPPDVLAVLERDMNARAIAVLGDVPARCRVEPNAQRTHVQLAQLAAEEGADLIVTGSRQYAGLKRLWHGSVSRALLKHSPMNVAVVPLTNTGGDLAAPTRVNRHVLVATDFSPVGNASVAHALTLLPEGGLLTLMHVAARLPTVSERARNDLGRDERMSLTDRLTISKRLRHLVPSDAAERGVFTQTIVESAVNAGQAISQAAERLSVDVICLATEKRSAVSRAFFGSVTRTVHRLTRRPLLVVPVSHL